MFFYRFKGTVPWTNHISRVNFFWRHFLVRIKSLNFDCINPWCNICIIYLYFKFNCSIRSFCLFCIVSSYCNRRFRQIKHQTIWCINRFISNIIFYKCKYNIVSFLIELYTIFFFPYTIIFNCFGNFLYNCIIVVHCNFAGFKTLYFTGSIIRSNKIFFYFIIWKVSKSFPVVWKYLIKLSCIS